MFFRIKSILAGRLLFFVWSLWSSAITLVHRVGLGYGVKRVGMLAGLFLVAWDFSAYMWLASSAVCFCHLAPPPQTLHQSHPHPLQPPTPRSLFYARRRHTTAVRPWESLSAWVVQGQSATQYGITRHYGMGMGFMHEGELVSVEFQCGALQLAIANWEAVRGYMEYELNDLHAIQDPLELQAPGDPSHEGLHTFRNARASLHRRIGRKKWVGLRLFGTSTTS
jgi:hypothetical protein